MGNCKISRNTEIDNRCIPVMNISTLFDKIRVPAVDTVQCEQSPSKWRQLLLWWRISD